VILLGFLLVGRIVWAKVDAAALTLAPQQLAAFPDSIPGYVVIPTMVATSDNIDGYVGSVFDIYGKVENSRCVPAPQQSLEWVGIGPFLRSGVKLQTALAPHTFVSSKVSGGGGAKVNAIMGNITVGAENAVDLLIERISVQQAKPEDLDQNRLRILADSIGPTVCNRYVITGAALAKVTYRVYQRWTGAGAISGTAFMGSSGEIYYSTEDLRSYTIIFAEVRSLVSLLQVGTGPDLVGGDDPSPPPFLPSTAPSLEGQ
jgi:hypothetical protein